VLSEDGKGVVEMKEARGLDCAVTLEIDYVYDPKSAILSLESILTSQLYKIGLAPSCRQGTEELAARLYNMRLANSYLIKRNMPSGLTLKSLHSNGHVLPKLVLVPLEEEATEGQDVATDEVEKEPTYQEARENIRMFLEKRLQDSEDIEKTEDRIKKIIEEQKNIKAQGLDIPVNPGVVKGLTVEELRARDKQVANPDVKHSDPKEDIRNIPQDRMQEAKEALMKLHLQ
jgi:hypothetical protein